MATESKRMQQIRGTAALWASENPVLLAGEVGIETDTDKFKIGDGSTAWNSLDYHTHAWGEITGKPSTFTPATHTHAQADITNLVTDLAGKAASSHTHAAADITSGTIATARLGSGTANASTFLRGDQTWATVSGGAGADRGVFFDVRDYGALPGLANEADTTSAFQAAVDAAETAGGGVVYIPSTGAAASYYLRRPVWVGVSNITIMGEGIDATRLTSYGPAFITVKHPKYWDCAVTTYTDVDTSSSVTVKTGGILTDRSRYRMDLSRFITGGDMAPGGGRPPLDISVSPGSVFGLRTRRNVVGGRYPQAPLATGDNNGGSNYATQWSSYSTYEWNFAVYHHESTLVGGIAGAGSVQRPDPWILWGDGTDYVFDVALTDSDGIRRTFMRCKFPQTTGVGLHRITIQFDPAAATDADRIRASVDRTRLTVTRQNLSHLAGEYHRMNSTTDANDFTNLWTTWNAIANWTGSDFTIANEAAKVGSNTNLELTSGFTDYTVILVSCHREFKHAFGAIGATITKTGGAAADDNALWYLATGAGSDATVIGWVANEITNGWSPAGTDDDINLKAFGKGRSVVWGYLHPKGPNDAIHSTKTNLLFKDFSVQSWDNWQNSCGMLIGAVLNLNVENVWFRGGHYWSLAMMQQRVSYPLRVRNMRFGKGVHVSDCSIWAENWVFDYATNCAILSTGAELVLKDLYGLKFDALSPGIIRCYAGQSIAAGLDISKANFNIEGDGTVGPNGPCIYYQKAYAHGGNRVILQDVVFGEPSGPFLYLDDTVPDNPVQTRVDVSRCAVGNGGAFLVTRGKDSIGTVEALPLNYLGDTNEYLEHTGTGAQISRVKSVDRTSYGLPSCGVFVDRMHEIHVQRPADGAPSKWRASFAGNEYMAIQNVTGPTWVPIEFAGTDRVQHPISANVVPSLYAECTLPWPADSATSVEIPGVSNTMARKLLATLLTGATAPDRDTMSLRWGVMYANQIGTGTVDNFFFHADSLTNSSYWASAGATAAREKRTNAGITVTGGNPPELTVKIRRRWSWGLHLGTDKAAFIVGRTNKMAPSSWYGMGTSTYTISSGSLRLGLRLSSSGWVNTIAHQILDWMMGGTFPAGIPSTLYFGLSSTAVSMSSPSATEPSGGAYARVAKARNATHFEETGDAGYIWHNKTSIEFPAPSGTDWGLMTYLVIYDAATVGNILGAVPLNRPVRIRDGDQAPVILPGALQISL